MSAAIPSPPGPPTLPPVLSWARVGFRAAFTAPASGQVLSVSIAPRAFKVDLFAPRWVLWTALCALLGNQPWIPKALIFLAKAFGVAP